MEEVEQGSSRSTLQQLIVINLIIISGDLYDDEVSYDDYDDDVGCDDDDYKGEQWQVDDEDDQPGSASLWVWRVQPKTNSV